MNYLLSLVKSFSMSDILLAKFMQTQIRFEFDNFSIVAELLETPLAKAVRQKLPFSSQANRWGEEIYFTTPVKEKLDGTESDLVEKGDVAYWPPGNAVAIFFGPTPASLGDECRAASPVSIFARIVGDLSLLSSVCSGSKVLMSLDRKENIA